MSVNKTGLKVFDYRGIFFVEVISDLLNLISLILLFYVDYFF